MIFGNININNFKVGIYIRLSREDGDKQESESIINQRDIIMRYVNENGLQFVNEYVDDGVSGTTFDRPAFNNMIRAIEDNQINMIITKDLSRLGRDYIKTGYYLENYFPEHNIRYVAINDGIDTFLDSTCNDITPFKAIMNDMYAKDISKKIRSVVKEKQKKGEYMCTIPPYGYKKDPNMKNHLIIDEKVKDVVETIFELYSNGKGTRYIANYLNNNNIPSPLSYIKNLKTPKKWNDVTILNMLKNEVYIGNTVSNKKTKLSYKSKKRVIMPKDQYIKIENTHEPIIDREMYQKVQFYLANRDMSRKTKHDFLFRGLLVCHTCKRKLTVGSKTIVNGIKVKDPIPYITCTGSRINNCPAQHMNYNKFETEFLKYLKDFCKLYADKEHLKNIYATYEDKTSSIIAKYKKEIETIDNKIITISSQIDNIYFDKLNKVITENDYFRYSNKFICDRNSLEKRKVELNEIIQNLELEQSQKITDYQIDNIINDFLNMEHISKSLLYRLLEKIEIDENKNVYVFFNFSKLNIINETINEAISFKKLCKRDLNTYNRKSKIV